MTPGDTFTFKGQTYRFDGYRTITHPGQEPYEVVLGARFIKTTQKFSGNTYCVCRRDALEA